MKQGVSMSTKRRLILGSCVVAIAALVLVLDLGPWRRAIDIGPRRESTRERTRDQASGAPSAVTTSSGPTGSTAPPRRPEVRNVTPEFRAKLLAEIRAAQQTGTANASSRTESNAGAAMAETDDGSEDSDRDYINAAMEGIAPMLMDCYRQGLKRAPHLAGHVVITFTIEGATGVGGVISESTIDANQSDLADPDVQECMRNTIYALEVDPPTSGGVVRVTYPFTFTPPGE